MALVNYRTPGLVAVGSAALRNPWVRQQGGRLIRRAAEESSTQLREMARRAYRNMRNSRPNLRRMVRARPRFKGISGIGITAQHDRQGVYRKKYMKRWKKRRFRKFSKRVLSVSEKALGSRTILFNTQYYASENGVVTAPRTYGGEQLCMTFALYGNNASGNPTLNNLRDISAFENAADPTAVAGGTVYAATKYLFQSAVLDITFRNSSYFTDGAEPPNNTPGGKLEVDIYEITARNLFRLNTAGSRNNLSQCFDYSDSKTNPVGGVAANNLAINLRGVTPWELPLALSQWGMKIHKKTKYFVESLGTFTYQMRDPRRHAIDKDRIEFVEGANMPGLTKFVYVIAKLVPGYPLGTLANQYTIAMDVGVSNKYLYKIPGFNEDRDVHKSNTFSAINVPV